MRTWIVIGCLALGVTSASAQWYGGGYGHPPPPFGYRPPPPHYYGPPQPRYGFYGPPRRCWHRPGPWGPERVCREPRW